MMAIVEVRIDDRLIHGQVCGYCIPHYKVERILIIDNEIVNDEARKTALKFGCPPSCKLSIFDSKKAADKLNRKIDEGIRVMILCRNPRPLLELVEYGYMLDHISIGNMSTKEGSTQLKRTVYLTKEDKEDFHKLAQHGVKLLLQEKPTDAIEDLTDTFKKG